MDASCLYLISLMLIHRYMTCDVRQMFEGIEPGAAVVSKIA